MNVGESLRRTDVSLEGPAKGRPHEGKTLLAIQAHSDDIALFAAGTVAKLVREGYRGHLVRATNDDMGDDIGCPGTIGQHALRNEIQNRAVASILGLEQVFDLNYGNHRLNDVSQGELISRLVFIIRAVNADTVISWDPWAQDEPNPDHYALAKAVDAASWIAGRSHDYPEHFVAGFRPHQVSERYYYARVTRTNRVVDITNEFDQKIDANRANRAKGPGGRKGSSLRKELLKQNLRLPLLGDDDLSADRNYIAAFVLRGDAVLGSEFGTRYAEAFRYVGPYTYWAAPSQDYLDSNTRPIT